MKALLSAKKLNIAFSFLAVLAMWAGWLIAYYTVRNDYIIPSFGDTMRLILNSSPTMVVSVEAVWS